MKTLFILRHAKSSRDDASLADHDRPLNERGKKDALRMGRFMAEQGFLPDLIVTSTARRARKTTKRVVRASGYAGEIRENEKLYVNDPAACLEVLRSVPDDRTCAMIVGHNPSFEELLEVLTGEGRELPTAALAKVSLDIASWADLNSARAGRLDGLWVARDLDG